MSHDSIVSMDSMGHIEALSLEPNWKEQPHNKNISDHENIRLAPQGLPKADFERHMCTWNNATVHLQH